MLLKFIGWVSYMFVGLWLKKPKPDSTHEILKELRDEAIKMSEPAGSWNDTVDKL